MKQIIGRWQAEAVRHALTTRRAVHLTGARQCGKTTLVKSLNQDNIRYLSLDVESNCNAAQNDPTGFLARPDGSTLAIDEIQKVPSLLDCIKLSVDENDDRGQFLLTGSSNLHFAKSVRDSLAGRLQTIRLRTLTEGEIRGGAGDFLQRACEADFPSEIPGWGKRDVIRIAFRGGFPEPRTLDRADAHVWFNGYLNDLFLKDIRDVTEIRKIQSLQSVADWMFAHSSKFFEMNELCAKAGLAKETLGNYISALCSLYVFDGVRPWAGSDYARLGKRTKYFAADSGFLGNVLDWDEDEVYFQDDACGKLIETWVHHELASLVDLHPEFALTHYRDSDKREIDFLIESPKAIVGIEVKSGSVVGNGDFTHLKWFSQHLAKKKFIGIVLYSGGTVLRFGAGYYAVPFGALAL